MNNAYISLTGTIIDDSTVTTLTRSLDYLGAGISRRVYALDSETVLKVSTSYPECNRKEASTWERIKGTDLEEHFAAVIAISPSGEWLVMARADDKLSRDEYSTWASDIGSSLERRGASDLHAGNVMRMTDGSIRVIDYGFGAVDGHSAADDGWGGGCECSACNGPGEFTRQAISDDRHHQESCAFHHAYGGECTRCELSKRMSASYRVRRNTEDCAARSRCFQRLAGHWTAPSGSVRVFCTGHLPNIGPVWHNWTHPQMFCHAGGLEFPDHHVLPKFGVRANSDPF